MCQLSRYCIVSRRFLHLIRNTRLVSSHRSLMRLAFSLRLRRGLSLMQVNPPSPLASPSTAPSHSRTFAQTHSVDKQPSASPKRSSDTPSVEQPPAKVAKMDSSRRGSSSVHQDRSHHSRSGRGGGASLLAKAHKNNFGGGRGGKKKQKDKPAMPVAPGPVHSEEYIISTYRTKPMKKSLESNPKSPLANFVNAAPGREMTSSSTQTAIEGSDQTMWRCVLWQRYG